MDRIRLLLVRARHWQIFLFVGGLYFASSLGLILFELPKAHPEKLLDFPGLLKGFVIALGMSPFFLWFWSMGSFLNGLVDPAHRPGLRFFWFALIYPPIHFVVFFAAFGVGSPLLWTVNFPLHMLGMVCMFYLLYFVSKSLALVELGRSVSFYDYAGPFLLLWFFPFGVWIVQPRLNRIYADEAERTGHLTV